MTIGSRMTHRTFWCRFMLDLRPVLFIRNPLQSGRVVHTQAGVSYQMLVRSTAYLWQEELTPKHKMLKEEQSAYQIFPGPQKGAHSVWRMPGDCPDAVPDVLSHLGFWFRCLGAINHSDS